jgi:Leucine-rich repeat (LRR) protein
MNELTSLNVSGLTKLNDLTCSDNKLTSLNVNGCTGLAGLYASKNKLSSLNPSGVPGLIFVNVTDNSLSSLDLRAATNLVTIVCEQNYLTSLNVSGLTKLEGIVCNDNRLTTLDVSGLGALVTLNCYNNNLTSINFSGATNLENLDCSENRLTSLNTAGLVSLGSLYCYDNALTALDLSSCPDLVYLECGANQLTALNFSGTHNKFKYLYCNNNLLATLDVNNCPNLETLECISNQLTSLSVNNCNNLETLNCYNNRLTSLALHASAPVPILKVWNNFFPSTVAITGPSIAWTGDQVFGEQHDPGFVAVTNITGLPRVATAGVPLTLSGTIVPQDATNQAPIEWEVVYDNDGTAGQIEGNTFTAVNPGRCEIRATIENGLSTKGDDQLYAQGFEITVRRAAASVTVSGANAITAKGGTTQLIAAVAPLDAEQTVTWSSSNTSIATVDDSGLVTAVNYGTATIRATAKDGTGKYGEKTITVSGQIIDLSSAATIAPIPDQTFTGNPITPAISLTAPIGITYADYTVGYSNNVNVGTATVTVTGKGNYTGTKTATFNIIAAKQNEDSSQQTDGLIDLATFSTNAKASAANRISVADKVWTGKALKSGFAITAGGKKLKAGTDYTITANGANKDIGKGSVTIKGNGIYKGTKVLSFKITPKKGAIKKLTAGKKTLTVKWSKLSTPQKITGYKVEYKLKGATKWKVATVSAKKTSLTINKLTKGKKYQVRIYAYKTIKSGPNKGTYNAPDSAVKTSAKVK